MARRKTIVDKVFEKINVLELNQGINKDDLASLYYEVNDYFVRRALDVHICKAKKRIPDKSFKSIHGVLTRIK